MSNPHPQCVTDDGCPRPGNPERGGRCWWHDLTAAIPEDPARDARLEGTYRGHRPVGW